MPCSPARSEGIHSPLQRGGVGGGADYFGCWRTGHGDHRPTKICKTNYSRTGSLCPVLQQEVKVFTPLSSGEGLGVGLFIWGAGVQGTETLYYYVWGSENWC